MLTEKFAKGGKTVTVGDDPLFTKAWRICNFGLMLRWQSLIQSLAETMTMEKWG